MLEYAIWLYQWFKGAILAVPGRVIALAFFLTLFLLPLISTHPYLMRILTFATIFSIFAASWDFLTGFTGLVNLGHSIFFGMAAYTVALLNIHFGLPSWITVPTGAVVSVLTGMITCIPTLRLRGFYLGLVTLSFPLILVGLIFVFTDFTGGEMGLYGLDSLTGNEIKDYYVVLVIMLCSVMIMWKLTDIKSRIVRTGVIFHAIREDEITARASGIDTVRYRLVAFSISGLFAGLAGSLYACYLRVVGPSTLELFFSFQAILWSIFGGFATIYGPIAGVYILYPLMELARLHKWGEELRFLFFPVILVATLLFMPNGLAVWILDKIHVNCPRCKLVNMFTRRHCRACRAALD